MSYTVELPFPARRTAENLWSKLTLTVTVNESGSNATWDTDDKAVYIENIGEVVYDYDIEDFLIVPGSMDISLIDASGWLQGLLFNSTTDRKALVKWEMDRGDGYVVEFSGKIIDDSIEYDHYRKLFSFTIAPSTDVLNSTALWTETTGTGGIHRTDASESGKKQIIGVNTQFLTELQVGDWFGINNVFHQVDTITDNTHCTVKTGFDFEDTGYFRIIHPTNPLGYDQGDEPGNEKSITQLILDIYKVVNPGMVAEDITFKQNWLYFGFNAATYITAGKLTGTPPEILTKSDFQFSDLKCFTNRLFFDVYFKLDTLADVLRGLAFNFGCITGMYNNDKAFFISAFDVNNSAAVTVNTDSLISSRKRTERTQIDYVELSEWRTTYIGTLRGVKSGMTNKSITRDVFYQLVLSFIFPDISIGAVRFGMVATGTVDSTPYKFYIAYCSDARFPYPGASTNDQYGNPIDHEDFVPLTTLLADVLFKYRNRYEYTLSYNHVLRGTDYSILGNYTIEGVTYQAIYIRKDYQNAITEIKGVKV